MKITREYEPVSKNDVKVMASRRALSKRGFPASEVDKIDALIETRKDFIKRLRELAKLPKMNEPGSDKRILSSLENPICDICGDSAGLRLSDPSSIEQEAKPPSSKTFVYFGSSDHNGYIAYKMSPLGIVIDYQNCKVYRVCGDCQLALGLTTAESGILIHNMPERQGYGFVNLDMVEKLIEEHKRQDRNTQ